MDAWVIRSKDKKGIMIINVFQSVAKESNCQPNKIWVDQGSGFYNKSMQPRLESNNIKIY